MQLAVKCNSQYVVVVHIGLLRVLFKFVPFLFSSGLKEWMNRNVLFCTAAYRLLEHERFSCIFNFYSPVSFSKVSD